MPRWRRPRRVDNRCTDSPLANTGTFLPQEGLHYTVDCGKDLFTATTQNWGKTRMVSLEELARTDR